MKLFEVILKLLPALCKVLRWVTRQQPHRGTFLVVEDDRHDAAILERVLAKRGWKCEIARSAEVAQGMVAHRFYPVAFVDLRLPGMSGSALLQFLSEATPDTHLVVCCGEPSDLKGMPEGQWI